MFFETQPLSTGDSYDGTAGKGLVTFDKLNLLSKDYAPIIKLVSFTTKALDGWELLLVLPGGDVNTMSHVVVVDARTPGELSTPGGWGGFKGCDIVVPREPGSGVPWTLQLHTGTLTAPASFAVSYGYAFVPSGVG